jgi:hypothetical protein
MDATPCVVSVASIWEVAIRASPAARDELLIRANPARTAAQTATPSYLSTQPAPVPFEHRPLVLPGLPERPNLIRALLPGGESTSGDLGLDSAEPGDRIYRFSAPELKELSPWFSRNGQP